MSELASQLTKEELKKAFESIEGEGLGFRRMDYTWRDVSLYALAVGVKKTELDYIYEKSDNFKVLPTFALLPYINSIQMNPLTRVPMAANEILGHKVIDLLGGKVPNRLHMAMELFVYRPIQPIQGTFLIEDQLEKVWDWGDKGVVGETKMDSYDLAGNHVATCKGTHWTNACGNFGGDPFKSRKVEFPDREPDFKLSEYLADNQAVLYRLTGDTYNVHIDHNVSGSYGYKAPFMQGLGTLGFASRMGIQEVIPNQPERVTHIYAQMRAVCYPGQNVTFAGWQIEEGKVHFKLLDDEGKPLLDNGMLEYK